MNKDTIKYLKDKAAQMRSMGATSPRFIDAFVPKGEAKSYKQKMKGKGWRVLKDAPCRGMREIILTNAKKDF